MRRSNNALSYQNDPRVACGLVGALLTTKTGPLRAKGHCHCPNRSDFNGVLWTRVPDEIFADIIVLQVRENAPSF